MSARGHTQRRLDVLVHHVADANCWDDLEEVGPQAPVEAGGSLRLEDVSEDARHRHLPAALHVGCGERGRGEVSIRWLTQQATNERFCTSMEELLPQTIEHPVV